MIKKIDYAPEKSLYLMYYDYLSLYCSAKLQINMTSIQNIRLEKCNLFWLYISVQIIVKYIESS